MIDKLYEASASGVKIKLIVRAGCSLVPSGNGRSKNIQACRLVDMYLEHARVYWFHHHGDELIYLSSADWMNRNLNRRIEVGFPIKDQPLKEELMKIIQLQLNDGVKLTPIHGKAERQNGTAFSRAQVAIHQWLKEKEILESESNHQRK